MGWTTYHAETKYSSSKGTYIDRKEECDKLFNCDMVKDSKVIGKFEVKKSSVRGSTYYAAVKQTKFATDTEEESSKTFGMVVLTKTNIAEYDNFSYKEIDENMGPNKYGCPAIIINMLDETDNEYAKKWREKCLESQVATNWPTALRNLPVGTYIKFKAPCDLKLYKEGEDVTVWKVRANVGSSQWIDGQYRYSPKIIGDEYEIVRMGHVEKKGK